MREHLEIGCQAIAEEKTMFMRVKGSSDFVVRHCYRSSARSVIVGVILVMSAGCSFFACSGGGPLTRSELGDWCGFSDPGAPSFRERQQLVEKLSRTPNMPLAGMICWSKSDWRARSNPIADGLDVNGFHNVWGFFLPGKNTTHWLLRLRQLEGSRKFYGRSDSWSLGFIIGYYLFFCTDMNVWDVETLERVGFAKGRAFLGGLLYHRHAYIRLNPALVHYADPRTKLVDAQFVLKDGSLLLLGVIGWGRVNHKRYIQILWIPIPVGTVE
jgi:hypothetical protein